jgi:beta-lactamase regulating signal transducer with metallopeptidase domain/sporulation protein YlmC with PRC-barrel domain
MSFVSPVAMHSLGWALLHFLWQGTAIAAFAAAAMALCRRSSVRYWLGVVALVLMLLAPFATFSFYAQQQGGQQNAKSSPLVAVQPTANDNVMTNTPMKSLTSAYPLPTHETDALPWLVEAWLLGVAFFSLRSAGGFFLLERERRRQSSVISDRLLEICFTLQDRLGISRAISYCECKWLQAPAVIGWFRPVVFLPVTALTGLSEDQLQAVIAHELAHVQRLDPFVNVFQVCVETLLFYHPAVWWLNKKIRAEREHCCDETAVALCGNPVEYARALTLMEEWRSAPVFAMAANRGPLTDRIVRVLGLKTLGAGMRGIGLTGSLLCLTAALVAGNALINMAHPTAARAANPQAATSAESAPSAQAASKSSPTPKPSAAQSASPAPSKSPSSASSYIDEMESAGLKNLTVDELVAMKVQDVTPEYVREMQQLGLQPDVDHLVAMRVQGITPEYVRELRAAGLNPNQDELIALKVQGADGAYYRELKDVGINPDVNHLIGLKVQGVTAEYVRELRAAGLAVTADQVIALKVQDVTPEYVRDIKALGLAPSANELIAMRIQDVTPEYIKVLQSAGFKLGVNDIIGAKVQDVTTEFIEQARKHGFKDLTLQKLIQLRQLGILDSKADI